MNYEGKVTAVNATMWFFVLDHKLTVYMGLKASQSGEAHMPEIGENVQIYNAHYIINGALRLEALFLCKRSRICCDNSKTSAIDDDLIALIDRYNLGCADVKAIAENLQAITTRIVKFTQNTAEQIMWNVVEHISTTVPKNRHTCTNRVLAPFNLKTISDYRFVDSHSDKLNKIPAWSFGTHSKIDECDKLIGYLKINKRYGVILLHDAHHRVPCIIKNRNNLDLYNFINCLVVINSFRIFTESFKESDIPNLEYILFDVSDMFALDKVNSNDVETLKDILTKETPENIPYIYKFTFKLLRKGTVNVNKNGHIECWLEVLLENRDKQIYLGLNAHQVQLVPFLNVENTYEVYHSEELIAQPNIELARLKKLDAKKFQEKMAIFVEVSTDNVTDTFLSVTQVTERIKSCNDLISFKGTVHSKSLVPCLSSRTKPLSTALKQFGTPGSHTHALTFEEKELRLVLYLNNWESLQMPLGLVPGMTVSVKNVLPQSRKYLKSSALTTFEIVDYEPMVPFDTVNLCKDVQICDKYSYLGWGNLIPTGALIWAHISSIYIRSLKLLSRCESGCTCNDAVDNCIDVTITFYTHDEMGSALVISRSLELLRLLIGLELSQWKIWCASFKTVSKYIYNDCDEFVSEDFERKMFCDALTLMVQTVNIFQICSLDLKCRKIDSNEQDDNDGMPLWFCVDARTRHF